MRLANADAASLATSATASAAVSVLDFRRIAAVLAATSVTAIANPPRMV